MSDHMMTPPVKKLLLPQQVAQAIYEKQLGRFNGQLILHMQQGQIIMVEEKHVG